jgi:hypothetical protein
MVGSRIVQRSGSTPPITGQQQRRSRLLVFRCMGLFGFCIPYHVEVAKLYAASLNYLLPLDPKAHRFRQRPRCDTDF